MAEYIPNTDGLMRSRLRDTIKRLRRIRAKCGKEDEEGEGDSSGDPFIDLTNAFIRLVTGTKANITERNDGCREHGQDRMAIEQSVEIRKQIRQMEVTLEQMREVVDKAERLLAKENKKKKPKKRKVDLLQKNYDEKRTQYDDCVSTLAVVKEMDSERVVSGARDINATKEMTLGKKAQLRAQLLGMRRGKQAGDEFQAQPGVGEYVDDTVGGGRLEDHEETKEQMKVIAQQDEKINAGLDRLKEGVGRLHSLAVEIGGQVDMQSEMLEHTETTMDRNTKKLKNINRRMNKLLKETKPMNTFMNVCCCILILAIVGFFLVQFNVI